MLTWEHITDLIFGLHTICPMPHVKNYLFQVSLLVLLDVRVWFMCWKILRFNAYPSWWKTRSRTNGGLLWKPLPYFICDEDPRYPLLAQFWKVWSKQHMMRWYWLKYLLSDKLCGSVCVCVFRLRCTTSAHYKLENVECGLLDKLQSESVLGLVKCLESNLSNILGFYVFIMTRVMNINALKTNYLGKVQYTVMMVNPTI